MAGKKRADRLEFWDAERMAMPIGTLISVLSATAKKYKGEGYSHLRFVFDYGWGTKTTAVTYMATVRNPLSNATS